MATGSFDACGGVAASSGCGVRPAIPAGMRARRMRARTSSEPRGVERARRRWVAARSVTGVSNARARARRRRRRRRCAVVVITRTGVAGPYTHESRHLLISNASHMYNERNRLTRQKMLAAGRAP